MSRVDIFIPRREEVESLHPVPCSLIIRLGISVLDCKKSFVYTHCSLSETAVP